MENNTLSAIQGDLTDQEIENALTGQLYGNRFEEEELRVRRDQRTGRIVSGPEGGDTTLIVTFTVEPVFSKKHTFLANKNGDPGMKYIDVEMINIQIPGRNDLTVRQAVTDYYIWRFPNEYAAFKAGRDSSVVGMPLELWIALEPSMRVQLQNSGFRTVEQIASMSDSTAMQTRGYHKLKTEAKEFLKTANAAVTASELQEERLKAAAREAELSKRLEQLESLVVQNQMDKEDAEEGEEAAPTPKRYGKKQ